MLVDVVILVGQDLHGVVEGLEDDALFLGVLHLFLTGGELLHAAAVDDVDLGAQTLGAAGGVHSHVAAAHNGHLLGMLDGGVGVGLIGLHQVDTGQELVGGVDAPVVDAGDVHEHGQARAGADEHGLEAHAPPSARPR